MYERAVDAHHDDTDPDVWLHGIEFHDTLPSDVITIVGHAIDTIATYEPGDYVTVQTEHAGRVGVDRRTPLVVDNPIVQVGPDEDAYLGDARMVDNDMLAVIELEQLVDSADLDVDLSDCDGDRLVVRDIVYDVEIATPRADGQIDACVPQSALESWTPDRQSRTEIQPKDTNRLDSRQVYRDPDGDPCPVCGSQWYTHEYTYRPRQVTVRCSICEQVRQRERP